ncbi:MAG: MATE family efflux transporter, partial [Kiritimatiellae bacterium]|nr:MATE family efflux transporter [Kiritimatiellia bacterium]
AAGCALAAVLALPCALAAAEVVAWFRDDPEVVAVGAPALRWQSLTVVLNHPTVCTNMLFQVLGLSGRAAFLSTMRSGLFFFPLILTLPGIWGVRGVELAQPLADLASFAVSMPFLVHWYRGTLKNGKRRNRNG